MRYPIWEEPFTEALTETDPQKLQEKVFQAEFAIFERQQELALSKNEHQESEEISSATRELLRIKTEKLKWPDFTPNPVSNLEHSKADAAFL